MKNKQAIPAVLAVVIALSTAAGCAKPPASPNRLNASNSEGAALAPVLNTGTCPAREQDLLGHWKRIKAGEFEEFALARQDDSRVFSSWLHGRAEMMGTWTFAACTLSITNPDNDKLTFDYRVTSLSNHILELEEIDGSANSAYKRIR